MSQTIRVMRACMVDAANGDVAEGATITVDDATAAALLQSGACSTPVVAVTLLDPEPLLADRADGALTQVRITHGGFSLGGNIDVREGDVVMVGPSDLAMLYERGMAVECPVVYPRVGDLGFDPENNIWTTGNVEISFTVSESLSAVAPTTLVGARVDLYHARYDAGHMNPPTIWESFVITSGDNYDPNTGVASLKHVWEATGGAELGAHYFAVYVHRHDAYDEWFHGFARTDEGVIVKVFHLTSVDSWGYNLGSD